MRALSFARQRLLPATVSLLIATTFAGAADLDRAIERIRPSLVRIRVVWTQDYQGREIKYEASGSGVIISRKGHVITNHHVAGRATRIVCVLASNEELEATLLGTDALSDIAVLKLNVPPDRTFPAVTFGDSRRVRVGDEVLAMGSPLALSQSVTRGIVSNTKMVMPGSYRAFDRLTMDGEPVGAMVRWLGHDAPIFPGNSGGPLVNHRGEVIGINEISFGLGGAIPAHLARAVADQIIAHGHVRRSWLGVSFQPLLKDGPTNRGVLVRDVLPGSPAAQADLRSGDILIRLNGQDTTVRFDEEIPLLNQQVAALPIGRPIKAVLQRDGKTVTVTLTTVEREPAENKTEELKEWGLAGRNLSRLAATELKLDSPAGVMVASVRPGGPSGRAKPPLQDGDLITAAAGQTITNVAALARVTEQLLTSQTSPVPTLVSFQRGPTRWLTVVAVGVPEQDRPAMEARKAWLPVDVQIVTREIAAELGVPDLSGVRIIQVYPHASATANALQVGDLIVALDGEPIEGREPGDEESFLNRIRQYRVGATPTLTVRRGQETLPLTVELERTPPLEREMARYEDRSFEFTARDVSFFDRTREEWPPDRGGALVVEVKDGGWAALGELAANDLIETVDGESVGDVTALEKKLTAIAAARPRFVVLRILRGIHTHYLQLETTWNGPQTPEP